MKNKNISWLDSILFKIMIKIGSRFYSYLKVGNNRKGSTLFFTNYLKKK